jgi:hypothetical protein
MSKKLHYVQSEHNPQAMKELNTEWMPINPCPCGCLLYPDSHECNMEDDDCKDLAEYEGGIKYQIKLLKCLLNEAAAMNLASKSIINVDYVSKMLAMLKQLEEKV